MARRLGSRQESLLGEAARRWMMGERRDRRLGGDTLTTAWTGLGTLTDYRTMTCAGLMRPATSADKGCACWWRLTDKGAAIVQSWIDEGLTLEDLL
jgi:hypothetical protein